MTVPARSISRTSFEPFPVATKSMSPFGSSLIGTGTHSGDENGYGAPCIGGRLGPGRAAVIGVWTTLHLYRCSLRHCDGIRGHKRISSRGDGTRHKVAGHEHGNWNRQ